MDDENTMALQVFGNSSDGDRIAARDEAQRQLGKKTRGWTLLARDRQTQA